ncbi:MAG: N-acetyltransferase family protein [Bacteroidetes bacterium]|nr:MAG: N-acetyltransferase family protein [Bacteroidota bacterium]
MDSETTFRVASPADWQAIIAIYNQGIDDGYCNAFTSHLSVEGHRHWLQIHDGVEYAIFVAEVDHTVVGWCSLSPYRIDRQAFRTIGEISYYFDRAYRGKGIGYRLAAHAIELAPEYNLHTLLAFLLDINKVSVNLLEKLGFIRWGHFPDIATVRGTICGQFIYGKNLASLPGPAAGIKEGPNWGRW